MGPGARRMRKNGAVARPESPQPRRGHRGRRSWVTVDDGGTPAAEEPDTDRYVPRRRYPWHDDPDSFAETGSVAVTLDGEPVTEINELECVDGQVWANIWQTDRIVRIDPADGRVTAVVDAAGLLDEGRRADADVLNGIAALGGGEYLVTGKLWPAAFRVRFTPGG